MDDIFLTWKEKLMLRWVKLRKRAKLKESTAMPLIRYGLLQFNYLDETNEYGEFVWDGTCSVTEKYIRYRIYKRDAFVKRIITPVVVTILTNIALWCGRSLLEWLKECLKAWLQST